MPARKAIGDRSARGRARLTADQSGGGPNRADHARIAQLPGATNWRKFRDSAQRGKSIQLSQQAQAGLLSTC